MGIHFGVPEILAIVLIFGVPFFLICRWLWRAGSGH